MEDRPVGGPMIGAFLNSTPWFWPALALAVSASLVACRPLARVLRTSPLVGFLLVLSLGGIVALTLTPGEDAFSRFDRSFCYIEAVGPIGVGRVLNLGERGLNVLLFLPLGACIAVLPRSRIKAALIAGAVVLPFIVEGIQYALPAFGRSCSSVDVVDNLTGLLVGFAVGGLVRLGIGLAGRRGPGMLGPSATPGDGPG